MLLTPELLRSWPLPAPDTDGDKESRGRVLVFGGAPEMPGAVILAATAALRAGAGKLQIAAGKSVAPSIAMLIPEALVMGLAETKAGVIVPTAMPTLAKRAGSAHAILIGPGLIGGHAVGTFVRHLLKELKDATVVLDAEALKCFHDDPKWLRKLTSHAIITPHAGEMANILGISKARVQKNSLTVARKFSREAGVVTVLKGAETLIVAPDGTAYRNTRGNVGLATSGSGDCLAGLIAGIAARGASPLQAAAWGVFLHASAGDRLASKLGPVGYLPRELLLEIPGLMKRYAA